MDITGAQMARVRKRIAKEVLLPAGFDQNGTMYVREQGIQRIGIDYQASQFGGQYTINICFHYNFLPCFFRPEVTDFRQMHLLDFWLDGRLDRFINYKEGWWPYGETTEVAAETLRAVFHQALATVDRVKAE